jgi:2-dehydro-3-deoxygluconokinase
VQNALATARAAGITTSLDLNYRPAVWGDRDPYPMIHPLAKQCDVIIGNPGAVSKMLRIETSGTPPEPPDALRTTAKRLCDELGCHLVALTQREALSASEHGWRATLHDARSGTMHESRRYQVRLVDRVGGGDSFVAGLVYAVLAGRDSRAALDFATAAGALKLTIPGDFNRVSVSEVDRVLQAMA